MPRPAELDLGLDLGLDETAPFGDDFFFGKGVLVNDFFQLFLLLRSKLGLFVVAFEVRVVAKTPLLFRLLTPPLFVRFFLRSTSMGTATGRPFLAHGSPHCHGPRGPGRFAASRTGLRRGAA